VLGFVSADVIRLKKDDWFGKLSDEQVNSVGAFLESKDAR